MTDSSVFLPKLDDSKLYQLARSTSLLSFLVPDITTQMTVELELSETFPRVEDDGDDTRILVNYTNLKGNAIIYKFLDHERLDRQFAIDGFMDGFMRQVQRDDSSVDVSEESINATILTALNVAITTVLELNTTEGMNKNAQGVSHIVLRSLVAILFNDALDVIVAVQDRPLKEGQTSPEAMVVGLWIVKQRHASLGDADINEEGTGTTN
jgi:hypothetical protein